MQETGKPNVVFIFSDQQRWDTMGCYGQRLEVTPNLDALAGRGVLFQHAITPQPVCGPARAVLQTGLYATATGCFRNGIALPPDRETIAKILRRHGYECAYVGKWHLASTSGKALDPLEPEVNYRTSAVPPERRGGYDDYWMAADTLEATSHGYDGFVFDSEMNKVEFKGYRADCITDFALEYLEKPKSRPFFLFLSYIEPHHQNDHNRYEGPEGSKEMFKDFDVPGDLEGHGGDWRENYPDYLGCCWSIDKNFKRIKESLEKNGLMENTLIIYTSDHGSHFRTRNSEYKRSCHEACVRVPLIIHGPGFEGGRVVEEIVSLVDLPPTILKAAGVPVPGYMQGRPLQDLLVENEAKDWPGDAFIQISESHVGRALRTPRWKYSVRAPGKSGSFHPRSNFYVEDFLYDLENDPHEQDNLVDDPAHESIRLELRERLKQRMVEAGEREPVIVPVNSLPDPPVVEISGTFRIEDEIAIIEIVPAGWGAPVDNKIPVPLSELLEDLDGKLVLAEFQGQSARGLLIAREDEPAKIKNQEEIVTLASLGSSLNGKDVMLVALKPEMTESADEVAGLVPDYRLLCIVDD